MLARSGDVRAFAQLALPYERALFAHAMRLERDPGEAWDLVQDTLERALRNFHQFHRGTNIRMWMTRIMSNLFIDHCRRRSRDVDFESIDHHDLAAPEPDLDEAPWQSISSIQLESALRRLDQDSRRVLEMRWSGGHSYRQLSQELGIPQATVGTRLLRARRKMRSLLKAEGEVAS